MANNLKGAWRRNVKDAWRRAWRKDTWRRAWGIDIPPGAQDHKAQYRAAQLFVCVICPAVVVLLADTLTKTLIAIAITAALGLAVLIVGRRRR